MTGVTFLPNLTQVRVVTSIDPDWHKCLNDLPYDFYHLPGYLELEAQRYNATAEAIVIKHGSEVFFLPHLLRDCDLIGNYNLVDRDRIYDIISPYGYSGILVSPAGQNPEFIETSLQTVSEYWHSKNICSAFLRLDPIVNSYLDRTPVNRYDLNNAIDSNMRLQHRNDVVICDLSSDRDSLFHFKAGFSDHTKSFATLETIVNPKLYDRLTAQKAESLGIMASELTNTSFFPAYRADRN